MDASTNSKLGPRERLWRAVRQLRSFDLGQLVTATETKLDTARLYIHALRRAGYFARRAGKFVLVRDSGPKPPVVLRDAMISTKRPLGVEDPNTGKRFGIDGKEPPQAPPAAIVPRPIVRRPYRRRSEAAQ
jgi:hypothetical protein